MILKRIVEFAEKHIHEQPKGYQPRFITKVIQLDRDGRVRNVVALSGERRGQREGMTRMEPQETPRRASGISPRLISDNVNYVLGRVREKDTDRQAADRHAAWKTQLREAAAATGEPAIESISRWIESGGPAALCNDPRLSEDDDITFEVDGVYPTELPAVRLHWAGDGESVNQAICIVTGSRGPVTDRMPSPIKGVPEGQMSGTALISVNNPAGESYGLSAALNSPVSADAAEKLCNGLNLLLNERAGDRYKYSLRVGRAVYIAWCRKEADFDLWSMIDRPDPAHVQQFISQAYSGAGYAGVEATDFYVLSLSANAARIVVRDYHETTLGSVQHNLGRWFKRLDLIGLDGEHVVAPGIYRLAASLYRDANKEMPAHVPTALIASAVIGRPLPDYLLGLAIKRNLAMQGPFVDIGQGTSKTRALSLARISLIKALVNQSQKEDIMEAQPDPRDRQAFNCGRLLAVLDSVYIHFINADKPKGVKWTRPKSNVSSRFYGAASASPASVFGKLMHGSRPHLTKLRGHSKDFGYELKIEEIATQIGTEFPRTLDVRRQGIFALGYYRQTADDRASRANSGVQLDEATVSDQGGSE